MKVYRWEETEHHYIAVVRPDELFDLSTLDVPHPEDRERSLKAVHRIHGEHSTYAEVYGKRSFLERLARAIVEKGRDVYAKQDLKKLRTAAGL